MSSKTKLIGRGGAGRGQGRHPIGPKPMKKMQVILDEKTIEQAKTLGEGNLSAGLREAVRRAEAMGEDR